MVRYKNLGGNSGISEYEIGSDYIKIKFNTGKKYSYSYNSAGVNHIEQMKVLAQNGKGLNSYIMRYVKYKYE